MGKAVLYRAGQAPPLRRRRRFRDRFAHRPRQRAPRRRGQFDHAAEEALLGAAPQQYRAVAANEPERHPVPQRTLRLFGPGGQALGNPHRRRHAILPPWTQDAARPARRADDGAQVHQSLREIAGPRARHQRRSERLEAWLRAGQRRRFGEEPGHHPLDIAVDRRDPTVERDRRDCRRAIVANPRKGAQLAQIIGELPVMAFDDGAGAGMEVAGARVIAGSLPQMQHLIERRCGQCTKIGPACHELVKIGADRRHRGLLQHDFAEPHPVGIGALARGDAPRQIAALSVVPGKQSRRVRRTCNGQGCGRD